MPLKTYALPEAAVECREMTWQLITATSPPWDGVPVLVWRAGESVWISGRKKSRYAGIGHDWYLGSRRVPPTHWMPIPEPPPT